MTTTESSASAPPSTQPKVERLRAARALALEEATERFNNELLDDEERLEILVRIKWLKKALAS